MSFEKWLLTGLGAAGLAGLVRSSRARRAAAAESAAYVDSRPQRDVDSEITQVADRIGVDPLDAALAVELDNGDELSSFRNKFHIPKDVSNPEGEAIYLCGNSLGLQPKTVREDIEEELKKWEELGVEGHFEGKIPWARVDEFVTGMLLDVVGAKSVEEVAVMNSLSVNLHLLLVSFYRPTQRRFKIIMEDHAFCSDQHVIKSQLIHHGYSVEDALITIAPRDGEKTLRTQDILDVIEREGDKTAVVMLSGVQYYTGQLFDMEAITKAGHAKGCYVGFDLAHAVGNAPLKLHDWNVDFACWCSYKYLNSHPGGISGIFMHESLHSLSIHELPRFCGWWGQEPEDRFKMGDDWVMKPGAQSYQLSNPAVLPTICLFSSLKIFEEAGMDRLRAKSELLTGYLAMLLRELVPGVTVITPENPNERGCQLSLEFPYDVSLTHKEITARGVICDIRRPNAMRIAPVPLYNSFQDVHRFVSLLKDHIKA